MKPVLPEGIEAWRPHQAELVEQIAEAFASGCCLVMVDAPTGTGKSISAEAARLTLGIDRAVYIATTKLLQKQVLDKFSRYARKIEGRGNYHVLNVESPAGSWRPRRYNDEGKAEVVMCPIPGCKNEQPCDDDSIRADDCEGPESCRFCTPRVSACPYLVAKAEAKHAELAVLNYAYWLRAVNYAAWTMVKNGDDEPELVPEPLVILDEADTLEHHLLSFIECHISRRMIDRFQGDRGWNLGSVNSIPKLVEWLDAFAEWLAEEIAAVNLVWKFRVPDKRERQWKKDLVRTSLTVKRCTLDYEAGRSVVIVDKTDGALTFKPILAAPYANHVHWRHGERFLAMSATILDPHEWVASTGWPGGEDSWKYIKAPSIIPPRQRPIFRNQVAKMSKKHYDQEWYYQVPAIEDLVGLFPGERVIVHTHTFDITKALAKSLTLGPDRPLFYYEEGRRRNATLDAWLASTGGVILAPSLERGVSLDDDLSRVSIICKIPYLDLSDPHVDARRKLGDGERWYLTNTVRDLVQTCGRGVRGPEDWGVVIILDGSLDTLERQAGKRKLFPSWWIDGFTAGTAIREEILATGRSAAEIVAEAAATAVR